MPKLGLGLSLPQTRVASASLIPASGLSLWLKADAGVTTTPETFISQVVISGGGRSAMNGTYTRASGGETSFVKTGDSNFEILWSGADWYINGDEYYCESDESDQTEYAYNPSYDMSSNWLISVEYGCDGTPPTGSLTLSPTGNTLVTAWADQSGNGIYASPVDADPTYNSSDLNGKPTISLSSLGDLDTNKSFVLDANPMGASGTTAFAVVYVEDVCNAYNDNGPIFGDFGTANVSSHYPYGVDCSVYDGFASENRKGPLTAPSTITNSWSLYSVVSTTNDWRNYVNATLMHSDNANVYSNAPIEEFLYIGISFAFGYTLKGKIAEAITYNRVLTTPERQQVEQYLNSKYQIYPWRITISGAGTTTSNGEYVWDGVTLDSGKPRYTNPSGNYIYWDDTWYIYDNTTESATYLISSSDFSGAWVENDGSLPVPTSTLSYTP
jgi:hypothetical protein